MTELRNKTDVVLTVTAAAQDTIQDMMAHVDTMTNHYGKHDERVIKASASLYRNLAMMFGGFFGTHNTISKDGDLSLFVANGYKDERLFLENGDSNPEYGKVKTSFVYGMIWHQQRRKCEVCGTTEHMDPKYRNASYLDIPVCGKEGTKKAHEWDYKDDEPLPGEWSFHS